MVKQVEEWYKSFGWMVEVGGFMVEENEEINVNKLELGEDNNAEKK